jgi:23S rRNA (uracil1939-C5)-methyltransferase
MSRPEKGSEVEVVIDSLAFGGRGVARLDDFVLFVDRALPGDRVRARITKLKRRFGEGYAVEILEPGASRVKPPCPHYGICGGCRLQALSYDDQKTWKHQQVRDALERIGHQSAFELDPIVPAVETLGYRNKLELSFARTPDGPTMGFHRAGRWDEITPITGCLLMGEAPNLARAVVQEWARRAGLEVWDRRTNGGYLRHLIIRASERTGQVLLTLVTNPGDLPQVGWLEDELRERVPGVVGLLHAPTDSTGEATHGLAATTVFGRDWYKEKLLGLKLRVSSGAFLQTNTTMCEKLYEMAIEEAHLAGDEVVWDLYSGIGSIALALAGAAGKVIGVELVEEAVERARENADLNGITNVEFVVGDVAKAVRPLIEAGVDAPDVVVVDPPRAGLTPKAVRRVIELQPARVVYVSCNPTTLAGNAELLVEGGYRLERVRPVDMFPHTHHVECVARFELAGA